MAAQPPEQSRSALAVFIPEAEPLVKPFRDRFDPSAARGVPAHVTVLFPFKPPQDLTPAVEEVLAGLFSAVPCFTFPVQAAFRMRSTCWSRRSLLF
jgi:hypothetical protein